MSEENKIGTVEQLKAEGIEEAKKIIEELDLPEGFEIERIASGNYKFRFLVRAGTAERSTSPFDNVSDMKRQIVATVITLADLTRNTAKSDEIKRMFPLPEPEPEPKPEPKLEPKPELTLPEARILSLEESRAVCMGAMDIAKSIGLPLQVEYRHAMIQNIRTKIDILRNGGQLVYRDVEVYEEYSEQEPDDSKGEWSGEWTEYDIKEYRDEIPLEVLRVLKRTTAEGFYESYEVWDSDGMDSILVGVKNGYTAELARLV